MNFFEGFKKHFLNTSCLIAERIFRMAVGLFVGIYAAHYLGPKQFDLLSYAISFAGLFLSLSTFGLDSIVIRELLGAPERRDEFIGTAFMLKISGTLFMWIGIALALSFTGIDRQTILLLSIVPILAIFQALNVVDFNYQTEVNSKLVVHAQLLLVFLFGLTKVSIFTGPRQKAPEFLIIDYIACPSQE